MSARVRGIPGVNIVGRALCARVHSECHSPREHACTQGIRESFSMSAHRAHVHIGHVRLYKHREYRATYTREHLMSNTKFLPPKFLSNTSCRYISRPSYVPVHRRPYFVNTVRRTPTGIEFMTFSNNMTVSLPIHWLLYKAYLRVIARVFVLELRSVTANRIITLSARHANTAFNK